MRVAEAAMLLGLFNLQLDADLAGPVSAQKFSAHLGAICTKRC
jgi:hypothetical protein